MELLPLLQAAAAETSEEYLAGWVGPIQAACDANEIDSDARMRMFLAQAAHESAGLRILRENLNYSAEGLLRVFPTHFDAPTAVEYSHRPQAIANRVYASRMGNGDEMSGDGWRFRGGGIGQVTGRANYARLGAELGLPLEAEPERIEQPEVAAMAFARFWKDAGCNALADVGDFLGITHKVNGGNNGEADREVRLACLERVQQA